MNTVLSQLLEWAWDRIVVNKVSTAIGTTMGAAVAGTLALFGCDVNLMIAGLGGVVVASPMIFGTDSKNISESLMAALKKGVADAKK
jgi:hypothetical protein